MKCKTQKTMASSFIMLFLYFSLLGHTEELYSPGVGNSYPRNVYWGDTHVHTALSFDAFGNHLGLDEAYRFARGETVMASSGMKVQLQRPLDFLVVADHATYIGIKRGAEIADEALSQTKEGKKLINIFQDNHQKGMQYILDRAMAPKVSAAPPFSGMSFTKSIWHKVTETADRYYTPNVFTTFSGFEWSSFGSKYERVTSMGNLHRVVIFKDSAEKVNQVLPFSRNHSENPEDLWRYMEEYEKQVQGEVLAIPHNSNLSRGEMFSLVSYNGQPIDKGYSQTRARWEPLIEVTQQKGNSETHPLLSPDDEFADYELWNSWGREAAIERKSANNIKEKKGEYARSALKTGLKQQVKFGVNPFKFGMIGSTDSHTSLSTADDNNYWGKKPDWEPSKERLFTSVSPKELNFIMGQRFAASGYAAIWAEENTRESLFAAMKRKEVYATTGPRIKLRFFGGWDYQTNDALSPDIARIGYNKGVPMGGDLTQAPKEKSPTFLICATKDPDGANLDRVQVIKGWSDKHGKLHEKIYNVALSDGRKENPGDGIKPVGNTVDIREASYTNSIGDAELAVVWRDPDFDKEEQAFYYIRVLEIPTPRWTAYDAKFFNIPLEDIPSEVPLTTQERAYSSPIWYKPE